MRPLVTIAALLALGCAAAHPSQIVLGPYETLQSSSALWERTLAAVRAANYEPTQVDAARGQILVASRIYGSREQIMIQLYREGWIQVGVVAPATPYWGKRRIPPDLAEEHLTLSLALRERLEAREAPPRRSEPESDEEPSS